MSPLRRRRRPVRHLSVKQVVRRNLVWGLATVLVAVAAVYLAFGGPRPWGGGHEIRIVTRDAGFLRAGKATKVRVAGVDVGTVSRVAPLAGKPGLTEVTVTLQGGGPVIRRDATVKIRPRLFLEGNFFLDIDPGTPDAPPLGDHVIPPGATTRYVAADEVFSAFDSSTRKTFQQTLAGLGQGLSPSGARALNTLLRATPPVLSDLPVANDAVRGTNPGDLIRLVRTTGHVLRNLQQHEDGLRGTLTEGRRTFQTFAASQAELRATLAGLDQATRRAYPDLRRIDAVIPEARALIRDARPLVRRLPATLDLANPALRSLLSLARSRDVQGLTAELRPTLATLSATAGPLGTLMDDLRPVAVCLTNNALPILDGTVPDGSLSTGLPVYQELLSSFVGLGSAAQDFDANGPWVRYTLGLGNQLLSLGGDTQARADQPQAGSTPTPVPTPPLRPDVPCESQGVPSLGSAGQAFQGTQRTVPIDRAKVTEVADQAVEQLQGMDRQRAEQLQRRLTTLLGKPTPAEGSGR